METLFQCHGADTIHSSWEGDENDCFFCFFCVCVGYDEFFIKGLI